NRGNDHESFRKRAVVEYTLPSLENVIQLVLDEDLQRVLRSYKEQHEQIPKETPNLKVVIASTWRSGSTLLGEIISSYPGAFYHYEPLIFLGMKQFDKQDSQNDKVSKLLENLLYCNYTNAKDYLEFAYGNTEIFIRNKRLWNLCSTMSRFKCYMPENIGKLCSLFPLQVMKVVRVRLELLGPLLEDSNTKVIWLVRDPRGVMNSRTLSVTWCTSESCKKPKHLCSDLLQDYNTYINLKKEYPNQVMLIRYEDLAKDTISKTKLVFDFLGLNMHSNVKTYLNEHLNSEFEAPWSTIHNPERQSKKWMKLIPWNTVVHTQHYCRPVMKLLGYRAFTYKDELSSGNALQLLNVP
ncbi:UNVERIFIED_CONTAM: hypothetical protein RMT77_019597, partial [Armadillidium vulgare]